MEADHPTHEVPPVYRRQLADGRRVEVYEVGGEVVLRLFSATGVHYASHVCRTRQEAVDAASRWDGAGPPFTC